MTCDSGLGQWLLGHTLKFLLSLGRTWLTYQSIYTLCFEDITPRVAELIGVIPFQSTPHVNVTSLALGGCRIHLEASVSSLLYDVLPSLYLFPRPTPFAN